MKCPYCKIDLEVEREVFGQIVHSCRGAEEEKERLKKLKKEVK